MPQRISIKNLEWEHRFAAIFKCSSRASDPTEIVVADSLAIAANQNLQRVLKALQRDLIFKQIYQYAKNPTTRFLPFRPSADGKPNEAQELLNALITAGDEKAVETQAVELARRYMLTKNIQNGLLIFLVSQGKLQDKSEGTCAFVFKCDFEEISRLDTQSLFQKIDDAIVEKTKKGTLYPYYTDGQFDYQTVRVFDEFGETQYWLDFLDLGEPVRPVPQLQAVTLEAWQQLKPDVATKYQSQISDLSANRSLVKKDLFAQPADQLTAAQTEKLIGEVITKAGKQNISLQLDQARVTLPLDEFGKNWIIAENAGTRYIMIKGSELRMRTDLLNPIDIASRPTAKDAVKKLNIPV